MSLNKPKLHWWVIPGIATAVLSLLGGLGTCAVKYATLEKLPGRVEASEQKNDQQDSEIHKLTVIQETWLKIYQQQQQQTRNPGRNAPSSRVRLTQDDAGDWYCEDVVDLSWWWPDEHGRCD